MRGRQSADGFCYYYELIGGGFYEKTGIITVCYYDSTACILRSRTGQFSKKEFKRNADFTQVALLLTRRWCDETEL